MIIYPNRKKISIWLCWIVISLILTVSCAPGGSDFSGEESINLTLSAAVSLKDALENIETIYESQNPNVSLTLNLASSGSLRQQIERGAPVDVFISAATKHTDILQEKGLIIEETRRDLLKNTIVLIVPQNNPASINSFLDLSAGNYQQFSIGEPESVPAGKYAKEVLTNLGIFDKIKAKIVYAKDARQVLTYVAAGNVDAGIVYRTDGNIYDAVTIVEIAAENSHSPVVYPIAAIKGTKNIEAAKDLMNFMFGAEAKAVFEQYGFITINN
ncbi:MAG: molybdate ABC transporter substrate-binding protein [Cyanobacteriota bacterium]|nr:molybdate ABC transporter substrate-binding protein [Cyanobacteriota bacterium]